MEEVKLVLNEHGHGSFIIMDGMKQLGEMKVGISDKLLTAFHTEVDPKVQGRGLAKMLLNTMVAYAREHHLKVLPLCPYVHAQFKRHPDEYADIWSKTIHS